MEKLFVTALEMSIRGSAVIAAVLLGRLLLKKAPAVSRFALWALVAVALLVPVRPESSLSLMPAAPEGQYEAVAWAPQPQENVVLPEAAPVLQTGTYVMLSKPETGKSGSFKLTAAHIWVGGIGGMLLWAAFGWLQLRRKVLAAVHLKENIYLCDHIPSPFVLGVFRPRIYLPSELPEEQRDLVLAHERGHIFRWDHASRLLGWVVLAIHWYNPLVWLSFVLFCRDMEMACDEWVIRELSKEEVVRYSEALISCGLPKSRLGFRHLAFGEVSIKARVKNILRYRKPAFWISLAAVAVAAVVAVCFLTERPAAEEPASDADQKIAWTDERSKAPEQAGVEQPDATQQENPGFLPPLELTGALSGDGARALASFRDGTGYQFFDYEAQELVRILNALTAEDFLYEPQMSGVLSVTLTASGRDVYLESDTDLVVLVHEGVRWGIRDEDLSYFFRILYSVTDYEEYNVAPLGELRENYNMEEAMIDLCVIQEDGQLRCNGEVWEDFYASCQAGDAATVRIWESTDGVTCVRDLSFDGKEFCLYWYEDGELCTETWQYLHRFQGDWGAHVRDGSDRIRYHYDHYILTDDPGCTWDEDSHSLHHSQGYQGGSGHHGSHHGGAQTDSGHHQICSRYTYYPNHPALPDILDKAELVLDGKVVIATVVPESLARLKIFFEEAEETYEPKTYNTGPELVLWFREETVRIVLDLNNDLCIIDGTFYDYGPGYTNDGSYNALPEMLACFSITEWPQPVRDKYGEYIWW